MNDHNNQSDDAPQQQATIEKARRMIREGAEQLDRGEAVEGKAFMRSLREKHQRLLIS